MSDIKELLHLAITAIRNKDFQLGEQYCSQIISLNPTIADAYNLLGIICTERNEISKAIAATRKAILCAPNNLIFQNNLGKLLFTNNKEKEAIAVFENIIKLQPLFYQAYFNLGKFYKKNQQVEKAKTLFEKAIEIKPDFVPALNNLANILQKENKLDAALDLYQKALSINSTFPEIHLNIGHINALKNNFETAEKAFINAIQLRPNYWDAFLALGNIYSKTKQFTKAEKAYQQVLAINPAQVESLVQLGNIYRTSAEFEKAIRLFQKAISIDPSNTIARVNLGIVYFSIADHDSAKKQFQDVLAIDPANAESKFSLGKLYELDKKYLQSKELYEEVLKGNYPFNIQVLYELFLLKLRIADWSDYDALLSRLIEMTELYLKDPAQTFNLTPLTLNYFPVPDEMHLGVSKKYASLVSSEVEAAKSQITYSYPNQLHNGKIRIGFLSPDFRLHAVGLLLKDVFKNHDRNKVEIYLYAIVNIEDEYNAAFKSSCDVFRDISRMSNQEAANLINQDQVHTLIDLAGYTSHCRPHILAFKPAPLQLSYLGYPNTSGSSYVNYILGDRWLLPDELQEYYSEKFIHLPNAFIASKLPIAKEFPSKTALGLPENTFIFCCFNSIYKISPRVFNVWMKILQTCPDSVLWLSKENEIAVENLKNEAIQHGIEPSRIIFSQRLPMDEYLASYQYADVFLDTFYYSAGSTAACALQAGVPVLTLAGKTNSSRMGASLTASAGLEAYIAYSEDEYIQKAIRNYKDSSYLQLAKAKLREHQQELPLFDLKTFTTNLESCLIGLLTEKSC